LEVRDMRPALDPGAAAALVADGATVMIGGFMGVGSPHRVIAALVERGARGLTVIANDTARPGVGVGKLITAGCVARVIASHIGTKPETQRLMLAGQLAVELVPQGTLAERIRARGRRARRRPHCKSTSEHDPSNVMWIRDLSCQSASGPHAV
jgi:acetate CoA/acetoacetate CoA-transferase alpha subunit